MIVDIFKRKEH